MTAGEQARECLLCAYYKRMIAQADEILAKYDDPLPAEFIVEEAKRRECGHGEQEQS